VRRRVGPLGSAAAALLAVVTLPAAAQGALPSSAEPTAMPLTSPVCRADPLGGRPLYLRGTMNAWAAPDAQRFTWACDRWVLVTRVTGEQAFKIADEGWSADADLGGSAGAPADATALVRRGAELRRRFDGVHRFTVTMADDHPALRIESCPSPAPMGEKTLFLRGTLNNWAALDDYAFQYSCDAYYLNLRASGRHEFKVADAAWSDTASFGASADGKANFVHVFDGEHTVRVAFVAGRAQLSVGPKTFADPRGRRITDPVALGLRFDSRSTAHKRPFGAVPAGTTVDFAVTAPRGVERLTMVVERRRLEGNQEVLEYAELARVPMTRTREGTNDRFTARYRYAEKGIYGWWFEARIGGRDFALQNNDQALHWTREKGTGGVAMVGEKPAAPSTVRRFRQTVFDPAFKVPDWAPDIVYYYVFPERFRNGDRRNDPRPGVDRYHQHTVELHQDWNERPFRPDSGDGSDEVFNNDFFGGDLAGLIEKLDHVQALGANAIYLTPVFRGASNHKYDAADYRQIDPAFGSNADFERLCAEAAKRGIRVIPDTSLNHTGSDSPYFDRFGNFGGRDGAFANGKINPASPYARWYRFDPAAADPDKQYRGWVGVADLPELDKSDPGLRDFFYRAPDSVMKFWLDRGAAGWRMDVVPWVPDDFWREWRAAIKAHRPDALTVAETWFDASKYFVGDMFDSTMNYIFRNAALAWAAGGPAADLVAQLEALREAYPPQAHAALMNLLSSHDQPRALHHFGVHDDAPGSVADPAVLARAKRQLLLAMLLQMTYPGSPTVYYGDEVGVGGGDDPYNRRTFPWADLGGKPDLGLLAEVQRLVKLRREHAVLRRGSLDAPLHVDAHAVVWLRRHAGPGATLALVALSNADAVHTVRLPVPAGVDATALRDALDPAARVRVEAGQLVFDLPPRFGRVWLH
jgi:glycosidase